MNLRDALLAGLLLPLALGCRSSEDQPMEAAYAIEAEPPMDGLLPRSHVDVPHYEVVTYGVEGSPELELTDQFFPHPELAPGATLSPGDVMHALDEELEDFRCHREASGEVTLLEWSGVAEEGAAPLFALTSIRRGEAGVRVVTVRRANLPLTDEERASWSAILSAIPAEEP